jgi:hypothetical protein
MCEGRGMVVEVSLCGTIFFMWLPTEKNECGVRSALRIRTDNEKNTR